MRLLPSVLLLLATAWIVVDIALRLPVMVFFAGVGTLVAIGLLGGAFKDRVRPGSSPLSTVTFTVSGNGLLVTDDFNFQGGHFVPSPNGAYEVACTSTTKNDEILSLTVVPPPDILFPEPACFRLSVGYGVVYIVDAAVRQEPTLCARVRETVADSLEVPVFQELAHGSRIFGVAIELGTGNGEYAFTVLQGSLTAHAHDEGAT